ncbi:BTB/POZ domain-containing protein 2-like [Chrysoperla carnea]|uniref:BTB/POZ domain-containing protein 2-like n=1 Tax=Chrysoperla carnea TaxID=189513 RepID=UPI001D095490|nr:BTB/POZ domain-containing protein 2-like [Chrysoperla carnea]
MDSSGEVINKTPFGFLCNNEKFADIHFIVGAKNLQQRFPAHKAFLSARSPVFETMLFGSLAESKEVKVPDVEPSSFLTVLKFIYSNEAQIDSETVINTLYAANKYHLSVLEDHCIDFLKSVLSGKNAFLLLRQAQLFDKPELEKLCLDMIDKHATDAFTSDYFLEIDLNTLISVLERDTLEIFESKIFEGILSWSKTECVRQELSVTPENQQFVLGSALKLIRFSMMTLKEFINGPFQSKLLAEDEVDKLCKELALKTNICEKPRCCDSFHDEVRLFISRSFSVKRTYFFIGFLLHQIGNDGYDSKYNTKDKIVITLIDEENNIEYLLSQLINSDNFIKYDRPIMLTPDKNYKIKVQIAENVLPDEDYFFIISEGIFYRK